MGDEIEKDYREENRPVTVGLKLKILLCQNSGLLIGVILMFVLGKFGSQLENLVHFWTILFRFASVRFDWERKSIENLFSTNFSHFLFFLFCSKINLRQRSEISIVDIYRTKISIWPINEIPRKLFRFAWTRKEKEIFSSIGSIVERFHELDNVVKRINATFAVTSSQRDEEFANAQNSW